MRLFVGVKLESVLREYLNRLHDKFIAPQDVNLKWVPPSQLHLTLKFLGKVEDEKLPEIRTQLKHIADRIHSHEIEFTELGCFPERGPVRVIWAGFRDKENKLEACYKQLNEEFAEIGFPDEKRPFIPHVTIARVRADDSKGRLRDLISQIPVEQLSMMICSMSLFESKLWAAGAEYLEILQTFFDSGAGT